jgi:hypothetical protein
LVSNEILGRTLLLVLVLLVVLVLVLLVLLLLLLLLLQVHGMSKSHAVIDRIKKMLI